MRIKLVYRLMVIIIILSLIGTTACSNNEYKRYSAREDTVAVSFLYPCSFIQVHRWGHVHNLSDNFLPERFPIYFYHVTGKTTSDVCIAIWQDENHATLESYYKYDICQLYGIGSNESIKIIRENSISVNGIGGRQVVIWEDTVAKKEFSDQPFKGEFEANELEESPVIATFTFFQYKNKVWVIFFACNEFKATQFQLYLDYLIKTFKFID